MTMTDQWTEAAAHFGLSPEEAAEHKRAWEDLQRLGPKEFLDGALKEHAGAYLEAKGTGQPPDAATLRRLQARHDIIAVMAEWAKDDIVQEYLKNYDGPRH